jgi:hypothetical protein
MSKEEDMQDKKLLQELKRVLRYDRQTGHFHWKIHLHGRGGMIYPGDVAGAYKDGYTQIIFTYGKRHQWRAHRLAWWFMTGRKPAKGMDIEHKDGNRSNNRWKNLAEVSRTKNMLNLKDGLRSNNKSGHRGVSWRKDTSKWHARIKIKGQIIMLGDYAELSQAVAARRRAERQYLSP